MADPGDAHLSRLDPNAPAAPNPGRSVLTQPLPISDIKRVRFLEQRSTVEIGAASPLTTDLLMAG